MAEASYRNASTIWQPKYAGQDLGISNTHSIN